MSALHLFFFGFALIVVVFLSVCDIKDAIERRKQRNRRMEKYKNWKVYEE